MTYVNPFLWYENITLGFDIISSFDSDISDKYMTLQHFGGLFIEVLLLYGLKSSISD